MENYIIHMENEIYSKFKTEKPSCITISVKKIILNSDLDLDSQKLCYFHNFFMGEVSHKKL